MMRGFLRRSHEQRKRSNARSQSYEQHLGKAQSGDPPVLDAKVKRGIFQNNRINSVIGDNVLHGERSSPERRVPVSRDHSVDGHMIHQTSRDNMLRKDYRRGSRDKLKSETDDGFQMRVALIIAIISVIVLSVILLSYFLRRYL